MTVNINLLRKLVGAVCVLIGTAMLPSVFVSLLFKEYRMAIIFASLFVVLAIFGFVLFYPIRKTTATIKTREAFFIVALCWFLASVLSTIPFSLSGVVPNVFDAFFEAVSSITTTGANSIGDITSFPKSLVFWRYFLTWIGGMGILLFAISILPALGIGTANLLNAETVGSSIDKYKRRISENTKMVFLLYIALSALEFVLLLFSGMSPHSAMLNAFSSISNSGISSDLGEVSNFNSLYISIVIALFCVIGATNFSTMQLIPRGRIKEFFREPEIRVYFIIVICVLFLVTCVLWAKGTYGGLVDTLQGSFLQIISFITTAGYSVTDYNDWPEFCKMLLFFVIFIGGCSASTSGGIKISRLMVIFMLIRRNLYKRLHPNAVVAVKIGERAIPADKVSSITVFVIVYMLVFGFGSILLSLDGQSLEVTMSSVIGALSNTGLNLGIHSFGEGYAVFSSLGKLLLSVLMLLGRLELFALLILFTPTFWRGNR